MVGTPEVPPLTGMSRFPTDRIPSCPRICTRPSKTAMDRVGVTTKSVRMRTLSCRKRQDSLWVDRRLAHEMQIERNCCVSRRNRGHQRARMPGFATPLTDDSDGSGPSPPGGRNSIFCRALQGSETVAILATFPMDVAIGYARNVPRSARPTYPDPSARAPMRVRAGRT